MKNADLESWNSLHRNLNRRIDDMMEDIELLSALILMFIDNPDATRNKLMSENQSLNIGIVSDGYQKNWLANINHQKLLKLISQMQQRQRNIAANTFNKNDIEKSFILAHHKL